jgi:hypothetical protein
MSKISYSEGQLQKALDRWMTASDDLAKFASTNKLAPEHVEFLQEATNTRTKELRRQLAIEHVESKVKLPSLSKPKSEDKTGEKSDAKTDEKLDAKADDKPGNKPDADSGQKAENKPHQGFQGSQTSHMHRPGQ